VTTIFLVDVDIRPGLVRTFFDREEMLEYSAQLLQQGFFADVFFRLPGDIRWRHWSENAEADADGPV